MKHYKEGNENGVYWFLDWKGDSIIIHVEKECNPKEYLEEEYEFQYRPIFGFDVSDVTYVENKIMERYIMKEEINFFKEELLKIQNESIRNFTTVALDSLPNYFWHIPASSTGKYHPSYALGDGGLIRHTKGAVKIALELFNNHTVQDFTQQEKDIIISALLLHDGCKSGLNHSKYTVTEHPLIVVDYILSNEKISKLIDGDILNQIVDLIRCHMGEWNTDYKTKKEVLPKPKSKMERFVHMCDYLASRKCIEINFEV